MKKVEMKKARTVVDALREAVDNGADTAEEIHKSVARFPLRVLKRNHLFEKSVRDIEKLQDRTIGALYETVRDINDRAAALIERLLTPAPRRAAAHHR